MTPFSITYANSLFSLADEEQKSEAVLNDMQTVSEVLSENPTYALLLDSPTIRREERIALIDEAFSSADEYVLNFLKLLCEKKAVHLFGECFKFNSFFNWSTAPILAFNFLVVCSRFFSK